MSFKTDRILMHKIASESSVLYQLTEIEQKELKKLLLAMYVDIAKVCFENGLNIMLIGGSALGAVRHGGFIPWDDDLDVCMLRNDYEKLKQLLEKGILNEKYDYTFPSKDKDSKNLYLKIYKKNTIFSEIIDVGMPFPKGVFIDVFPIDSAPASILKRKVKGFVADLLSFVSVSVLYYQYGNDTFKKFMKVDKDTYRRYRLRIAIGCLASFMSHKKWAYLYDLFVASTDKTGYKTIAAGTKHYVGETLPEDVFIPISKGVFENIEVCLPNKVDTYLTNMYRNYMELPPLEKREKHFVYQVSL